MLLSRCKRNHNIESSADKHIIIHGSQYKMLRSWESENKYKTLFEANMASKYKTSTVAVLNEMQSVSELLGRPGLSLTAAEIYISTPQNHREPATCNSNSNSNCYCYRFTSPPPRTMVNQPFNGNPTGPLLNENPQRSHV